MNKCLRCKTTDPIISDFRVSHEVTKLHPIPLCDECSIFIQKMIDEEIKHPKNLQTNKMTKLEQLCEIEGLSQEEIMEQYALESVQPGICMNPDCTNTEDVEPDCTKGYCSECKTQSISSVSVLLGII